MSAAHTHELHADEKITVGPVAKKIVTAGAAAGIAGLGITAALGFAAKDDMRRFFFSMLLALAFFLSISLGALFFVVIQHLVKARWSVVVRRIAEILTAPFTVLAAVTAIIIIPMLMGNDGLYYWMTEEAHQNHHLHAKMGWLNAPFFAVRVAIYFGCWIFVSRYFFKKSVAQDESGDAALTTSMQRASAPAIIVFALSMNFAAFDILMSLMPMWFSTAFGVYWFGGAAMCIFTTLTLVSMFLQRTGRLTRTITTEHYHDLGKLTFAFVFFWSYIAFSQFMLIWYSNVPEETEWYHLRMFTDWKYVSIFLLVGHFAFPFLSLLSRWTKRILPILAFFCVWLLVMHLVDLFWLIMPAYDHHHVSVSPMDLTALIGVGGLFVASAVRAASKVNLVPTKDPNLSASLGFENF